MALEGRALIPLLQEIVESPQSGLPPELMNTLSGLLVRILDGSSDPLALMVIRALERAEDAAVMPALQVAAEQGTPDVRVVARMAVERLTELLGMRALEALNAEAVAALLPHPEPDVEEPKPLAAPRRTLEESALFDLRSD
jgi:hypothetical protein